MYVWMDGCMYGDDDSTRDVNLCDNLFCGGDEKKKKNPNKNQKIKDKV
jgi:hypothetical protein